MAQAVAVPVAGQAANAALPAASVTVQSFAYTTFGEQMGNRKLNGFGYNAEAFDADTGMINLRARQYEPTMNRFSQKDSIFGTIDEPFSHARYLFVYNNTLRWMDADGLKPADPNETRQYFANRQRSVAGKKINIQRQATAIAKTAATAYDKGKQKPLYNMASFYRANYDYLSNSQQQIYRHAMDKINAQYVAQQKTQQAGQKRKGIAKPDTYRGRTRMPADYLRSACALIMGEQYTPQYLDKLKPNQTRKRVFESYGNTSSTPVNFALSVNIQTYLEGFTYADDKKIHYGGYICDAIDRIHRLAWTGTDKGTKTIVMYSYNNLNGDKGAFTDPSTIPEGYLVYYAYNGLVDSEKGKPHIFKSGSGAPQTAETLNDIFMLGKQEMTAAGHMGMKIDDFIDYNVETHELRYVKDGVIHNGSSKQYGIKQVYITDLNDPSDPFQRFFLAGPSNVIDYSAQQ